MTQRGVRAILLHTLARPLALQLVFALGSEARAQTAAPAPLATPASAPAAKKGVEAGSSAGATLVAIVTSEPAAPLTRRVRRELEGLGVDVIVLKPPAEGSAMRAPLEQAARSVGAVAAVRLIPSNEGKVEVWVTDRATGKTLVRELDSFGTNSSDASVAVGTVELFRASLMELHSPEPPHGEVPATPAVLALALPAKPIPLGPPRLGLGVGIGAELGIGGTGPAPEARLAIWMRVGAQLGIRVLGETTLSPSRRSAPEGSVDVGAQWVGTSVVYDFVDPASTLVPEISMGIAATHVTTTGVAAPPFTGASADTWAAAPLVGVGVAWAFLPDLRLRADGLGAWALPAVHVRTPSDDVGRWGAPALVLSLGVEVLWGPHPPPP